MRQSLSTYPGMRVTFVLVDVFKCLPDKFGHGHHAHMPPPDNPVIFTLVCLEVIGEPPLQQFKCQAFRAYLFLKTDTHEHVRPEQEARSFVVNVMQGVTQKLQWSYKSDQQSSVSAMNYFFFPTKMHFFPTIDFLPTFSQ